MLNYLIRRLLLIPFTLFFIVLVNFVIINLAPGDPVTVTEISAEGNVSRSSDKSFAFGSDERYLQFREHYGLTLPILINLWPWTTEGQVVQTLQKLVSRESGEMSLKEYDAMRVDFGDKARFIMPKLLSVIENTHESIEMRSMASSFFARGGTKQGELGPSISKAEAEKNEKIAADNSLLRSLVIKASDSKEEVDRKVAAMKSWFQMNAKEDRYEPTFSQKLWDLFFETRLYRYLSRVVTFDFGTMRNDDNKTVISEVVKRFKYSLTLAVIPMIITFVLCFIFGVFMAYFHHRWQDHSLSIFFLVLYALPIFVAAPFLIEKVALHHNFPFTNTPIPISGFTSPDAIYDQMNSYERLFDVLTHIFLPLVAVMYGSLAAQARLSRTSVLEVLHQDYIRTARAKGATPSAILFKHVGRNASITIVTSIASSLGVILGGSLIVETLFEINGFGKFFYDAVINRDYNVLMFSSLAGSLLALLGYLAADIAYTVLDPRLTLE